MRQIYWPSQRVNENGFCSELKSPQWHLKDLSTKRKGKRDILATTNWKAQQSFFFVDQTDELQLELARFIAKLESVIRMVAKLTWTTNKPYRRFFALRCSSDECKPLRWATLATRTFAARCDGSLGCCCTAMSYRIKIVSSLRVTAPFVLIVELVWQLLSGSLSTEREKLN